MSLVVSGTVFTADLSVSDASTTALRGAEIIKSVPEFFERYPMGRSGSGELRDKGDE